jgi:hypothetical protein
VKATRRRKEKSESKNQKETTMIGEESRAEWVFFLSLPVKSSSTPDLRDPGIYSHSQLEREMERSSGRILKE